MANPYQVVIDFENIVAEWAGSKYAVAVESCTAAIFLCLQYKKISGPIGTVQIPKFTYPGVPCAIIQSGGTVDFVDEDWEGVYELDPLGIVDGALRFKKDMYRGGLHCLSFHVRKNLPIGRGGMILTDDAKAAEWLRKARFDGRSPVPLLNDDFTMLGWNMYLEPSQAARGIQLFEMLKHKDLPDIPRKDQGYPDLSRFEVYQHNTAVTIQPAKMKDAMFLLELKNDPLTRKNSILTDDIIEIEAHKKWLKRRIRKPGMNLIFYHNEPVGDLRIDHRKEKEISIRIHPDFRGKGIAKRAISLIGGPLVAYIVEGNIASMRAFIDNGFKPVEYIKGRVNYYKLCK